MLGRIAPSYRRRFLYCASTTALGVALAAIGFASCAVAVQAEQTRAPSPSVAYMRSRTGTYDRAFGRGYGGYAPFAPATYAPFYPATQFSGHWYVRPYPYHFDYYRWRWGVPPVDGDCPCAAADVPPPAPEPVAD